MPAGPAKGSDVPRINIGVFGVMNAGKSTLMNAITRQETSIVDATPGTTAGGLSGVV
jgi:predicted GTPase